MTTEKMDVKKLARKYTRKDGLPIQVGPHFDAGENYFFLRELTMIEQAFYEVKHALRKGRQFVPSKNDFAPGTESYIYRMSDSLGKAKKITGSSSDVPLVNVAGAELTQRFQSYGLGFEYTIDEIQAAATANRPLERDRAAMVKKGLDQQLDDVIAVGDATSGLTGLTNLSNTNTYTLATKAAGGTAWVNAGLVKATPDEILHDLQQMITTVVVDTREVERPTRILLPTAAYQHISTTARSSVSDTTILKYFLANHPDMEVESWERLSDAAVGTRMIAYDPNPINVQLLMAIEFDMRPPEPRNFAYYVPCRMKTGGVISRYPHSICYADGAIL
jgi:hypothetical protein